ncbi:nucleotidyltransferase-like protein [Cohnella faecalis]|uniref:Nucleotidyltransferase-like domain-containing protein n=1 Tax=Cohnella faecalis TaxID=2315694 RepID=A0A398CPL6_9BACL|nr:nucleotidyltransferase-like protein [Cohnella faecalis]RIE02668.1 hypothetical protein D3H35_18495 [Cohnella faecalis]
MDKKHLPYTDLFRDDENTVALLLITNPFSFQTLIDGMDKLVLVICKTAPAELETEHWMVQDERVQVRRITPERLERWVVGGDHRSVIPWLVGGEILYDRDGYLKDLQARLNDWPALLREQKLLCEFSRFIRTYLQANQDLKDGQILDAYSNILDSLHCWAHIALVEKGMHPELTVWEQMRRVNPGIYKLYEELTTSVETVEKRVQLLLLACEFSVLTQMKSSCALILRVLSSRDEPWTVSALQLHPQLKGLPIDFSLLLQKLVMRGLVREIAQPNRERGAGILKLLYTAHHAKG